MEQLIFEDTITDILHNIAYRVATNNEQGTDRGLLSGKMGMAIFLFHYASCYNNSKHLQVANSFIEDVRNNITEIKSTHYNDGLSGVDAGLRYLLKMGFIDDTMVEMPELARRAIYNSLFEIPPDNIHQHLHQLAGLAKFFAQDYRLKLLTRIGPFTNGNRTCVSQIFNLIARIDAETIPHLDPHDVLRIIDLASHIYPTGYREKGSREVLSKGLQVLRSILVNNPRLKPFAGAYNPFSIALSLLKIYERTTDQDYAALAIRLLEEYEGAVEQLYEVKNIGNANLLKHAIACKRLHIVLKEDCFHKYATDCLDFYWKRKSSNTLLQHNGHNDYSLHSGYAAEGMALLTLEGCIQMDWLEVV